MDQGYQTTGLLVLAERAVTGNGWTGDSAIPLGALLGDDGERQAMRQIEREVGLRTVGRACSFPPFDYLSLEQ